MITGCLQDLSYESCLESHSSAAMHVVNDSLPTWTYAFLILGFFCVCFLNILFLWNSFSTFLVVCKVHSSQFCSLPILSGTEIRNLYILQEQYPLLLQTFQQPGFPFIGTLHFVCRWDVLVRFVLSCFALKLILKVFFVFVFWFSSSLVQRKCRVRRMDSIWLSHHGLGWLCSPGGLAVESAATQETEADKNSGLTFNASLALQQKLICFGSAEKNRCFQPFSSQSIYSLHCTSWPTAGIAVLQKIPKSVFCNNGFKCALT